VVVLAASVWWLSTVEASLTEAPAPSLLHVEVKICPSVGVSPDQVVDVVTQYLTTFPERRHYAAASLVADALAAKFPCAQ